MQERSVGSKEVEGKALGNAPNETWAIREAIFLASVTREKKFYEFCQSRLSAVSGVGEWCWSWAPPGKTRSAFAKSLT